MTHCGIAVEATGQRDESVAGQDRAICQACVDALRASGGRCQVCSELLV